MRSDARPAHARNCKASHFAMRAIKHALDPDDILTPSKVLPPL